VTERVPLHGDTRCVEPVSAYSDEIAALIELYETCEATMRIETPAELVAAVEAVRATRRSWRER
jgi:hypothetical protein